MREFPDTEAALAALVPALVHRANNQLGILRAALEELSIASDAETLSTARGVVADMTRLLEVTGRFAGDHAERTDVLDLGQLAEEVELLVSPLANVARVALEVRAPAQAVLVRATSQPAGGPSTFAFLGSMALQRVHAWHGSERRRAQRPLLRLRVGANHGHGWISIGEAGSPLPPPPPWNQAPSFARRLRRRARTAAAACRLSFPLVESGLQREAVRPRGPVRVLLLHEPGEEAELVATVLRETGYRVLDADTFAGDVHDLLMRGDFRGFDLALVDADRVSSVFFETLETWQHVHGRVLFLGHPPPLKGVELAALPRPIGANALIERVHAMTRALTGKGGS